MCDAASRPRRTVRGRDRDGTGLESEFGEPDGLLVAVLRAVLALLVLSRVLGRGLFGGPTCGPPSLFCSRCSGAVAIVV